MVRTYTVGILAWLLLISFHNTFSQNNSDILPPVVWLRADIDSTASGIWRDFSGHGNHAKLSGSREAEEVTYINFNPTRRFIESSEPAALPYSVEGLAELTFMMVYQPKDSVERGLMGTKDGVERNIVVTTDRVLGPDSITDDFARENNFVALTTITQSWEEAKAATGGASLTLGGINNPAAIKAFDGSIAEVLVFDQVLPFINRVQYETYLAIKYGVPLEEGNYVSSREAVLWKAEDNDGFHYRITGIGRDDYFTLNQPQSTSSVDSTGLLLISAEQAMADQDFILWGDNNLELQDHKGAGHDSVVSILDRKWLVTVNGPTANNLSTGIQLDISNLPKDSLGFWLVIDRSGSDNFSIDNLEYFKADSISKDSIAYYNNIRWDVDGSGKDNFSFARRRELLAVVRTLQHPLCTDPKTGIVKIEVIAGASPYEFIWSLAGNDQQDRYTTRDSVVIDNLVTGIYSLHVRDGRGTELVRNMSLTMADAIPVNLGADHELQQQKEIVLDATTGIPDSLEVEYTWESSLGFSGTGGKVTVTEPGIYRVFVTNTANGCVFSDEVVISGSQVQRIELFPNPIHRDEPFTMGISLKEAVRVEVRIFDLKGNLYSRVHGEGQSEYQLRSTLPRAGQYLIVVDTPDGSRTRKIIVY